MASYHVVVWDVNDNPIAHARVTVDGVSKPTNTSGAAEFAATTAPTHSVVVEAAGYVMESIDFKGDIETADWNNSLLTRLVVTSSNTILTIHLGRLDVAPIKKKDDITFDQLVAAGGDVQAAIVNPLPRAPSNGAWLVYRDVFNDFGHPGFGQTLNPLPVWLTDTKLLPPAPTPGAIGWKRFTGGPANPPPDPLASGRFYWLLHQASPLGRASSNGPFAVAVWSPNINHNTPLEILDMVVFFSPPTHKYTDIYPFGVDVRLGFVDQRYISLGGRFLLDEYCFVYDLIARSGRQAIIVMPICRKGDWGPYNSGEGMFRLCREVSLFLHRECRTSNKALLDVGHVPRERWHSGGTLRTTLPGIVASDFGAIPRTGRIVVSAFSAGIYAVMDLMGESKWGLIKGYEQRFWGCPYIGIKRRGPGGDENNPRTQWANSWREIWDMDGAQASSWGTYLNLVKAWAFDEDPTKTRMVRMVHSLTQPNPKTDTHPTWKLMLNEAPGIIVDNTKNPGARELQCGNLGRFSVVHFDKDFVDIGPEPPWLGPDAHHGTPKIAFSYSSALSPVGVPH